MCRVFSCLVRRGCLLWPVCSLDKLFAFALLHLVLQGQKLAYYSRYHLTSYFYFPTPYDEKDIFFFFFVLVLGLVGLHRTIKLQLLQH